MVIFRKALQKQRIQNERQLKEKYQSDSTTTTTTSSNVDDLNDDNNVVNQSTSKHSSFKNNLSAHSAMADHFDRRVEDLQENVEEVLFNFKKQFVAVLDNGGLLNAAADVQHRAMTTSVKVQHANRHDDFFAL